MEPSPPPPGRALRVVILVAAALLALGVCVALGITARENLASTRLATNERRATVRLAEIAAAEERFREEEPTGRYCDLDALVAAGLLDRSFAGPLDGYRLSALRSRSGQTWTASADPVTPGETGRTWWATSSSAGPTVYLGRSGPVRMDPETGAPPPGCLATTLPHGDAGPDGR